MFDYLKVSRFIPLLMVLGCSFSVNSSAYALIEPRPPVLRGNYWVCPGGKGVSTSVWRRPVPDLRVNSDPQALSYPSLWRNLEDIRGVVIVGKTVPNYTADEFGKLKARILDGIKIPSTAYKLKRTKPFFSVKRGKQDPRGVTHRMSSHTYELSNAAGKNISITLTFYLDSVDGAMLQDDNGKIFSITQPFSSSKDPVVLRCEGDFLIVRQVDQFQVNGVTDQYGALVNIQMPIMFFIRELVFKTVRPDGGNPSSPSL